MYLVDQPTLYLYAILAFILGISLGMVIGVKLQPWVEAWVEARKPKPKRLSVADIHP